MATPAQLAEAGNVRALSTSSPPLPPALPPRANVVPFPPPYSSDDYADSKMDTKEWDSRDPRSSSTESLYPLKTGPTHRRTLLLVYIHGFMGNETSFQSFPAHVHNLLSNALVETHLVHTKIYPRYRSRNAIESAREEFSSWLQPNTRYSTDVVLLGHSMGGILAAEVSLKPSNSPATGQPFHHRILGTVNFDTPFLGIHPGVIASGISSLFRSAPETPGTKERQSSIPGSVHGSDQTAASLKAQGLLTGEEELYSPTTLFPSITSPLSSPSSHDPSFDPPFPNDIRLKERTAWSSLMHFLNKHSDNLPAATRQYFMSHLEFGSCLADYPGLKNRCERLHALEDVDELAGLDRPGYRRPVRRIRFVNYYTASTGRPKAPKEPNISPRQISEKDGDDQLKEYEMINMGLDHPRSASLMSTPSVAPDEQIHVAVAIPDRLSSQIVRSPTQAQVKSPIEESLENEDKFDMHQIEPAPLDDSFHPSTLTDITNSAEAVCADLARELSLASHDPALPPIPDTPTEPEPIDLSLYTDKDARKIAEKEQKRLMKVYQQAVRDRDIAIKDRKKLADKREKKARQELEKKLKEEEAKRLKEEKEHGKRKASLQPPSFPGEQASVSPSQPKQDGKPKKDRKFCMLPPKRGGLRDKCWVRVYMEGVDEVGAHCGLFSSGPHYETLVQGVAERIEGWVHEDALRRIAVEGEGGD